jgi:hypothetical protein
LAWAWWVLSQARVVLHPAVSEGDLALANDPDPSDRKDVSAADQVFHLDAKARFPDLDSLYLPRLI